MSIIAAAVAAVAAATQPALAQSSVTLFGVLDVNAQWGRGSTADRFQITNSGSSGSRIGFRGTEDLGGGLSAGFWLEAGVQVDNGTGASTNLNNQASGTAGAPAGTQGLTFNRRSTVSLAGNWGELRLGRDYTPQFWSLSIFDPFGTNGVGTNQMFNSIITGFTSLRASNTIGYLLPPNIGGVYGQAMYYVGENPSNVANDNDGEGWGARVGYAKGPLNVALAMSRTKYAAGNVAQNNLAGQWDFGVARAMAIYSWDKSGATDGRGWLLGTLVPVGPWELKASFARYRADAPTGVDPRTSKFAVGAVYNFSKRTSAYATYAHLRNAGNATQALGGSTTAPNASSSGVDIGLRLVF